MKHIDDTSDLPPRTWRGCWLAWPKWFRIGVSALLPLGCVQLILILRIAVGLQETAEITQLRDGGATIRYVWEQQPELFSGHHKILAGLYGCSWANVVEIEKYWKMTDEDLALIAARARGLEVLSLLQSNVSANAIGELSHCRQLRSLDLRDTDADDAAITQLIELKHLRTLDLSGTLVTDAVIPSLQKLKSLCGVDLSYTDVTYGAIHEWQVEYLVNERTGIQPVIGTEKQGVDYPVIGSLRWLDGSQTAACIGPECHFHIYPGSRPENWCRSIGTNSLDRKGLWINFAEITDRFRDQEYLLTLTIGPYRADPVRISLIEDYPSVRSFEFNMPCTKADALRSKKKKKKVG